MSFPTSITAFPPCNWLKTHYIRTNLRKSKSEILSQSHAPTSLMPQGLLNLFTKDEVLNLLAWLEATTN